MNAVAMHGYVLERASECINGDMHLTYDATPLGYPGIKLDCITSTLGELIGLCIRYAGKTYGTEVAALDAWQRVHQVA